MHLRQSGFTLIEILVVLVIVGIAVGGASTMISVGGDEELAEHVETLTVFSEHASEMAVITGEPVGLVLDPPEWRAEALEESEQDIEFNLEDLGWQYRWMKETSMPGAQGTIRRWVLIEDMDPVELPPDIELAVTVEERLLTWDYRPEEPQPVIAFYPEGEVTPFEIEFTYDGDVQASQHIVVNVWGEIEWKEKAEALREEEDAFF